MTYNNLQNEGGEGYDPQRIVKAEADRKIAADAIAQAHADYVAARKVVSVDGREYIINGNVVTTPKGQQVTVTKIVTDRPSKQTVPAGYVWGGMCYLPRIVAEAAIQ